MVSSLTQQAASELAPHGIRVNRMGAASVDASMARPRWDANGLIDAGMDDGLADPRDIATVRRSSVRHSDVDCPRHSVLVVARRERASVTRPDS